MALQSIAGDPLYCHMHTLIFWWIILFSTADVASSLLMFDAEGLVPCLLQQVLPLILNHADAETILGDPKVCTKKYYCYSYFKSPFTDKNNLTKDLWPEQRCYSPFKGENSTAGELIRGRCNYQGTFFTASVENFTGHNDQLYPFGQKKKFVQEKTGRSYRISYYHYPPWQWYDRDLCYHTNPSVSIQGPRLEFSSFQ